MKFTDLNSVSQDAFSGITRSCPVEKISDVFLSNKDMFTDNGIKTLFKSLGIPKPKFFLEKDLTYQKDTFEKQLPFINFQDVFLLVRENLVECSFPDPMLEKLSESLSYQDPKDVFSMSKQYTYLGEDNTKNLQYYVFNTHIQKDSETFVFTYILIVPIGYNGKVTIQLGMYDQFRMIFIPLDSMMKFSQIDYTDVVSFDDFLTGLRSEVNNEVDRMERIFSNFTNESVSLTKDLLKDLAKDKFISNKLKSWSLKHLKDLKKGNLPSDKTIIANPSNLFELLQFFTRYQLDLEMPISKNLTSNVQILNGITHLYNQRMTPDKVMHPITPITDLQSLKEASYPEQENK